MAEQHAYDAARFGALIAQAGPDDWARPSPDVGWTAFDVANHVMEWLPGFLAARTGIELSSVNLAEDAVAAWTQRAEEVQKLIEERGDQPFTSPMFGESTLAQMLGQFYVADLWMHSWDLAKSLGLSFDLGAERAAEALAGMQAMDDVLRQGGQFGPKVPVPDDAPPQDRFLGFIGRDPAWQPPA